MWTNESLFPGSPFLDIRPPVGQFPIYVAGKDRVVGHGIKIAHFLVVPTHVLDCGEIDFRLQAELPRDKWFEIAPDVSAILAPPDCGIKSAKTAVVVDGLATCASCVRGQGSLGNLFGHGFGTLLYEGSTAPGMSGAAYVQNGRVVGMHLAGGNKVNLGVPIDYLVMRLVPPESSEFAAIDAAMRQARSRKYQYRDTGDPDVVEVRVGNKYFRLSRDEFEQRLGYDVEQERWEAQRRAEIMEDDLAGLREDRRELRRMMRNEAGTASVLVQTKPSVATRDSQTNLPVQNQLVQVQISGDTVATQTESQFLTPRKYNAGVQVVPAAVPTAPVDETDSYLERVLGELAQSVKALTERPTLVPEDPVKEYSGNVVSPTHASGESFRPESGVSSPPAQDTRWVNVTELRGILSDYLSPAPPTYGHATAPQPSVNPSVTTQNNGRGRKPSRAHRTRQRLQQLQARISELSKSATPSPTSTSRGPGSDRSCGGSTQNPAPA
uniref:Serine protease n=1 Tax=Mafsystermes virus TaxID=2796611 RepID=A0A7T7GV06_9VIRU|nr:hypothetical protein [Mafsystermes virus]